jgi:hypothetical protein
MEPPRNTVVEAFRLKQGMEYTQIVDAVGCIMADASLKSDAYLVLDATGVGNAVCSIARERGLAFHPLVITAGDGLRKVNDAYRCAKAYMMTQLAAALESGALRICPYIKDASELRKQLEDFQVSITGSGHLTINAKNGGHDDLILATGLAYVGLGFASQSGFVCESIMWG